MRALKVIIVPTETETRVLGKDTETSGICLRARLPTAAMHTHALPRLLKGLASFLPVRAALVVPSRAPSCATTLYPDWFLDFGVNEYDLQIIGDARKETKAWWGQAHP